MEELEMLFFITKIYFITNEVKKYDLLKVLKLNVGGRQYKKIDELISRGFMAEVRDNPPTYVVDKHCRQRMWDFLRNSQVGESLVSMVRDNAIVLE